MAAKRSQEGFLAEAYAVWGDRWDYSATVYRTSGGKVTIGCRSHGVFEQAANSHLSGRVGCEICVDPTKDPNYFHAKASEVWGDRWNYHKTVYAGHSRSIVITCNEHGDFTQRAIRHLEGKVGCPQCSGKVVTTEDYVRKLKEVWGDRWDYSQVRYISKSEDIILICRKHGPFTQKAHKAKYGIVACGGCNGRRRTTQEFIAKAAEVWGGRWDYTHCVYEDSTTPVDIICPEHGTFKQPPAKHLLKRVGCGQCNGRLTTDQLTDKIKQVWGDRWDLLEMEHTPHTITVSCPKHGKFTQPKYQLLGGVVGCHHCRGVVRSTSEFIDRATLLWGGKWEYPRAVFTNYKERVTITCPEHGDFHQTPEGHFRGQIGCKGCQPVGTSKGETEMYDFVSSLVEAQRHVRELLPDRRELDIFVPSLQVAFEFNGVYWHSERFREKEDHLLKFKLAQSAGIRLYQIWEDDWNLRREVVENHIRVILGASDLPKVSARQTRVTQLTTAQAREFLDRHHIQGFASSSHYLGLKLDGRLLAVASFKREKNSYVLTRYATSALVRGGHSKLIAYFEKNFQYDRLVTFADLTFGDGGLYRATGWVEDKLLPPDYSYVVGGVRQHKFGYRIKRFKDDPNLKYQEGLTERQLAVLNDIPRIYDAGKMRFVKPHPDDTMDSTCC